MRTTKTIQPFQPVALLNKDLSDRPNHQTTIMRTQTMLVIIDSGIDNPQQLAKGVLAGAHVAILKPDQDGIAQIDKLLQHYAGITSLHIISHGSPGAVYLGNSQLSLSTLDHYASTLQAWSVPQLLFYGCNVAAGDAGAEFIATLHQLTGANIAASTTPIGHPELGGNWDLDVTLQVKTGDAISASAAALTNKSLQNGRAQSPFAAKTLAAWHGLLPAPANSGFEDPTNFNNFTVLAAPSGQPGSTAAATVIRSGYPAGVTPSDGTAIAKLTVSGGVATFGDLALGNTLRSSTFNLNAGEPIGLDLYARNIGDNPYASVILYDASGNQAATLYNGTFTVASGGTTSRVTVAATAPTAGLYYLEIQAGSYDETFGGAIGSEVYVDNIRTGTAVPLVADIIDIPDTATALTSATIKFNKPINASTFTTSDLLLSRGSTPTNLINAGVTITQLDAQTFRVDGLTPITGTSGLYRFFVNAATITDAGGTAGVSNGFASWQKVGTAVGFTTSDVSLAEGNSGTTAYTYTVTREGNISNAGSVNYTVTGIGADPANAADFGGAFPSGTVNFAANQATATITINVSGDAAIENDERFAITLSNPTSGTAISTQTATGTIVDDDGAPPPTLAIAATTAVQAEGNSGNTPFTFTVTRGGDTTGVTTANYTITGSGTNPANATDFGGLLTGSVSFAAGETSKTITVNVSGDTTIEADEELTVTLGSPVNAIFTTASATGTILDDDTPLVVSAPDLATASDTGSNTGDNITSATSLTFTGTVSAGATVEIFEGTTSLGLATVIGTNWTFTQTFSESNHSIFAKAQTPAKSTDSSPISFTVDTTAPIAAGTIDLAAASDTGASNTDNITADVTPTFTGALTPAEVGFNVTLYDGNTSVGTGTVQANGSWSVTTSTLSDGIRTLSYTLTDAAGNESAKSSPLAVTIDTTAPSAPSAAPDLVALSDTGASDTDNLTSDTTPTFVGAPGSGTAGDTVTLYDGTTAVGTATVAADGSWSVTASTLSAGIHNLSASFTDAAGSEGAKSSSLAVTIDATAPSAPGSAPDLDALSDTGTSNTDNLTSDTTPTFVGAPGSGTAGDTVTLYDGTTAVGTGTVQADGSWSVTASTLSAGIHNLSASFTDAAGNEGVKSASLAVTIDTTAPSAPSSAPDLVALSDTGTSDTDNLTSDTTPTFVGAPGSGTAGDIVTLYDGTTAVGTGTVQADGSWSVTASALGAGIHNLSASFTDAAGNESVKSSPLAVTIDTTAPSAPGSAPDLVALSDTGASDTDNLTSDTTPTFVGAPGSGTAGDTVTLYDGTTAVGTATVAADGSWSVTASTLSAGIHNLSASFTDAAGNEGAKSSPLAVTINTTAPSAPSAAPDLVALSDTGASDTDNLTSDTTPTFVGAPGSGTAGDTVTLYDGTTAVGTATVAADGSWSVTASALGAGIHNLSASFTDAAGNESVKSSPLAVTIDTTAPSAPGSAPDLVALSDTGASDTDNLTSDTTPTFVGAPGSGTAGDTVTLYDGTTAVGTGTVQADGSWSVTASALGAGIHNLSASFTDAAGNESTKSSPLAVTINTTAPSAPSAAPDLVALSDTGASDTDNLTSDTTPTFVGAPGSGTAGDTVTLYDGTTAVGTGTVQADGSWSVTASALGAGIHNLSASFTDAAGNEGAKSSPLAVTIDATAPSAPGSAPDLDALSDTGASNTDNLTSDTTPTFVGAPGSGTAGDIVTLYDGTTAVGTATVAADGSWSVTASTLSAGIHNLSASFTDAAGNEGAKSSPLAVTIDATAPSAPGSAPDLDALSDTGTSNTDNLTSDPTPTFVGAPGSGTAGDIVTLYDGTTAVGTATVAADGSWSVTASTLSAGIHNLSASFTDTAGNESTKSSPLAVTIDTTAPSAPSAAPDLAALSDTGASDTDNLTSDTTPTFVGAPGSGTAGNTVTLYDGTTAIGTTTVAADGSWSVTASTLSTGIHNLSASFTDAAGNEGAKSSSLAVTIDTTAPSAPSAAPDLAALSDTGISNIDDVTTDTTPTFIGAPGSGTAGDIVTLYDGTTAIGTDTIAADGSWAVTSSVLDSGVKTITFTLTDAAGNESNPSPNLGITVEGELVEPPPPVLDGGGGGGSDNGNGGLTNNNKPAIGGTVTPGSAVEILANGEPIQGAATVNPDGTWSFTPATALPDGTYQLIVRATTPGGGTVDSPASTLVIDTAPATVEILDFGDKVRDTSVSSVNFRFSELVSNVNLNDLELTLNGQPIDLTNARLATQDNQSFALENIPGFTADSGNYQISIKPSSSITDRAGNALMAGGSGSWVTGYTADAFAPQTFKGGKPGLKNFGSGDSDVLRGGRFNDAVRGGGGNDKVKGGGGNDNISGGGGKDNLTGGLGKDRLRGQGGGDRLLGRQGKDLLLGGGGNDRIVAGGGDDVIVGGTGNDILTGGRGSDTFKYNSVNEGTDTITDFRVGLDLIDLRSIFNDSRFAGPNRFAQFNEFVDLVQVGSAVEVRIDADGSGSGTALNTLAVLNNQSTNAVTSRSFVVG